MKHFVILFFSLVLLSGSAFAQGKYKKHQVAKGETVTEIAKKYKVTPYDIFRLNPDSQNGISEGAVLLIPTAGKVKSETAAVPVTEKATRISNPIHEVKAKETMYGLTKQYNVTEQELIAANPELADGLKIGQKVIIPVKGSGVEAQAERAEKVFEKKDAPSYMYHTVEAGETKYSIAKQYGMTQQLLEELNPEVKDVLPLGYKLKLDKTSVLAKEIGPGAQLKQDEPQFTMYTVPAKETMYNLTKTTGLTKEKIEELNPELKEGGLREGMVLKFPAPKTGGFITGKKAPGVVSLVDSLDVQGEKQLALLLPFNLIKDQSSEEETERVRTDRFLNMTLDFYAGALIAIDSAKTLGLPIKVKILDSQESKTSSAVDRLKSSLVGVNAVIGPFFQSNVERAAQTLTNIPVISPLSKEVGKPVENLYQSVPSPDVVRVAMLNFIKSKNANLIAVVDEKKLSSKQFIKNNYAGAKITDQMVTEELLKPLLDPVGINYILLDTESAGKVSNTVRVLMKIKEEYKIQLAVFERTDVLDNEEVPLHLLTQLKMQYASITNDTDTQEKHLFVKKFKEKNGVSPNQFATRGFDVTFDVILRLFQPESFGETVVTKSSEQVENKFAYRSLNGGNYNNGVYILYYDEDLSIKHAE